MTVSTPATSWRQNLKNQALAKPRFRHLWNGSEGVVGNFSVTFWPTRAAFNLSYLLLR
jgi:hypothetical protein